MTRLHQGLRSTRPVLALILALALGAFPALTRQAQAAEIWVYPSANTTFATSGDYTVTNDQTTVTSSGRRAFTSEIGSTLVIFTPPSD